MIEGEAFFDPARIPFAHDAAGVNYFDMKPPCAMWQWLSGSLRKRWNEYYCHYRPKACTIFVDVRKATE